MRAHSILELDEETRVELNPAAHAGIHLRHPTSDRVRVELAVPVRVQRIRHVHTTPVVAHIDHLRAAVARYVRLRGMCRAPNDAPEANHADERRIEGIGNVIASQLPRAPTRHPQRLVVRGQADIGDEWRHDTKLAE